MKLSAALIPISVLAITACTRPPNDAMCITGDQKACACIGGAQGVQVCLSDGTYAACQCPEAGVPNLDDLGSSDDLSASNADLSSSDLAGIDLAGWDFAPRDFTDPTPADMTRLADLAPLSDLAGNGIVCGTQTCSNAQDCCLYGSGAIGECTTGGCSDSGASPFDCDGPEDCNGGQCCVDVTTNGTSESGHASCAASCPGASLSNGGGSNYHEVSKLCHADSDCTGYNGQLLGVPIAFGSCCHSAATTPYRVCIPAVFASAGGYTCP